MTVLPDYRPDPRHHELGDDFFDVVEAARFPEHLLRYRNTRAAQSVGLDALGDAAWLSHFAHFNPLPGNFEQPLALRYHGHQFQQYNPDLGDGRGFLFAQQRDRDGRLLDLGTKGSGQTPWSRGGDGRLTLKGGVREVLATALLEALGVYTSKSFSLVETGEQLVRGDEPSPTRSSVLVRLGHSHIRFGSFQRQAYLKRTDNLEKLVDYSIAQYYPELQHGELADRTAALLLRVVERSADLAASWMVAGFVHGVLNTDNLNITGESFDYGPYRFLPAFEPGLTAAYFDHSGLYAYARQPGVVMWNLERLAETLLPICDKDRLLKSLHGYEPALNAAYQDRTFARLGLAADSRSASDRTEFVNDVYAFMHSSQVGFEQFFFDWYGGNASRDRAKRSPAAAMYETQEFASIVDRFDDDEPANPDALAHSYFQQERPCTLLIDEVESLWDEIAQRDDWSAFDAKLTAIDTQRDALLLPRTG